jgi:hypothetical protein
MRSKEEQIAMILNPRGCDEWARSQLKSWEKMEDKTYFDFINVTFEEVLDSALKHGFSEEAVVENFAGRLDDQTVLEDSFWGLSKVEHQYEAFRVERGKKLEQRFFSTRQDALEFIVKYFVRYVWAIHTGEYRRKHHPGKSPQFVFDNILSPYDKSLLKR